MTAWRNSFSIFVMLGTLCVAMLAGRGMAATSFDPGSTTRNAYANQAIPRAGTAGDGTATVGKLPNPASGLDATRIMLALGAVIVLILILRVGLARLLPASVVARPISTVKILARCPVSPRQHILLVQFGKRLLLVGDGGANLNTLCDLSDADEVAAILQQVREQTPAMRRFDLFFGRARKGFAVAPADGTDSVEPATEEAETVERFDGTHEINDPSLDATRRDLAGLSDKVKDLVRQLGRG